MVRKPVVFGLVLLTLGGLLAGCSSTNDGSKEEPSSSASSSDKAKEAEANFKNAYDNGDAKKVYDLLDKSSYGGQKVDTVILPKDKPTVTGNPDGTVHARILTLSYNEPYFDAQYTFNNVQLDPDKTYGVFAGAYAVEAKSPQGVFKTYGEPSFDVPDNFGGTEQKSTITSLLFRNISSAPEITDTTVSKLVELYNDNGYPFTESDFQLTGYRNNVDGSIAINLVNDTINPKGEGQIPETADWDASTNTWSHLR